VRPSVFLLGSATNGMVGRNAREGNALDASL
jgi:hypothetical protein